VAYAGFLDEYGVTPDDIPVFGYQLLLRNRTYFFEHFKPTNRRIVTGCGVAPSKGRDDVTPWVEVVYRIVGLEHRHVTAVAERRITTLRRTEIPHGSDQFSTR
jgi:hypothetical protein